VWIWLIPTDKTVTVATVVVLLNRAGVTDRDHGYHGTATLLPYGYVPRSD
jgi:hypothetical protein